MKKVCAMIVISLSVLVGSPAAALAEGPGELSLTERLEGQKSIEMEPKTKYAVSDLNIRKEPDLEAEILKTIPVNTPVEILAELDGWALVANDDGYAYTAVEYLADAPVGNRWNYAATPEERDLIYRIVMLESGAEPDLGQQAVTEVIMNMTLDDRLGDHTIYGVLSKKNQYSTWKYRNSSRANPTEQVKRNVDYVLDGKSNILPFQTIYFSRKAQTKRIQAVIGHHVFCNK